MNREKVNIIVILAALLALSGCGTTAVETLNYKNGKPILSAADARSMISVEIHELEPVPVEQALAYHSAVPSR